MSRTSILIIGLVATAVAVASGYFLIAQKASHQQALTPMTVARRHLVSEVSISGTAEAAQTVDLAFKNGGIVGAIPVTAGDHVATSALLMTLASQTLADQLVQAQASLSEQTARLRDLQNGTRPEQLAVTQAELASDTTALGNATQSLFNAIANAQSVADVAVRFTVDQFITNPSMSGSTLTFSASDSQLVTDTLTARRQVSGAIASWSARVALLRTAPADTLLAATADLHAHLAAVEAILDDFTRLFAMTGIAQSAANQTTVATARANVSAANDALSAAEQSVRSAEAAIAVTQKQLSLEETGATSETLTTQKAVVAQTRAQVAELEDTLKDQSIMAPYSGIVTDVSAKQGETAVSGVPAVSMISDGPLKVEGYVPEIHYSEIAVGESVRIELDAFPGAPVSGTLKHIDPTAVLRDGVPNFKVTVAFADQNPRIKPGLTAHAFIQTADKPSTLAIPITAVTGTGASATVVRVSGSASAVVPVVLGSVSTDGSVEVLSGLAEGDTILVNETKQYRIVPN